MMTAPEICNMAGRGERPQDLDAAGWLLWYRVYELYADYEAHIIDLKTAAQRKKAAILQYNSDKSAFRDGRAAMKRMADLYAAVEIACAAFRKDPTAENGYAIIEAIHGV